MSISLAHNWLSIQPIKQTNYNQVRPANIFWNVFI